MPATSVAEINIGEASGHWTTDFTEFPGLHPWEALGRNVAQIAKYNAVFEARLLLEGDILNSTVKKVTMPRLLYVLFTGFGEINLTTDHLKQHAKQLNQSMLGFLNN